MEVEGLTLDLQEDKTKTKIIVERYKESSGKWYDKYEYITKLNVNEKLQIIDEVKSIYNMEGFNFTVTINKGNMWNKYLVVK